MVKLAIRDDDMNFFTKVEDIEEVYREIPDFPVSFAVIPTVTDVSTVGKCPDTRGNTEPRWVGDNDKLVVWLKQKLSQGQTDVLFHGITHGYKFIEGKRYAEMQWRKEPDLAEKIGMIKSQMETLFGYPMNVFVAPSNKISKYGIQCVSANGMNFSGLVPITFDREMTPRNLMNYTRRWFLRAKDRLPYPDVLQYSDHKEMNACLLQGYDYLVKMFHYCEKKNSPMAVNVHYWHLRDYPQERAMLMDFVKYALNHGAIPSTMSDLLKNQS